MEIYLQNNDLFSIGFSYILPDLNYSLVNSAGYYVQSSGYVAEANFWTKYKCLLFERLVIEAGLRNNIANVLDQPDYIIEPRLSFKYLFSSDFSLKGSIGRYHQMMVTTSNEDDVVPLFETWIPIELPAHPERSDQFILGIDGSISKTLNFSIQGYYKLFSNLLGYNLNKILSL